MWAVQAALSNLRSKNCAGTNTGDLNARNVAGDAILWTVLKLQFAHFGTDTCTKTSEFAMSCLPLPHTIPSLEGECMQASHDHCIEGLHPQFHPCLCGNEQSFQPRKMSYRFCNWFHRFGYVQTRRSLSYLPLDVVPEQTVCGGDLGSSAFHHTGKDHLLTANSRLDEIAPAAITVDCKFRIQSCRIHMIAYIGRC